MSDNGGVVTIMTSSFGSKGERDREEGKKSVRTLLPFLLREKRSAALTTIK